MRLGERSDVVTLQRYVNPKVSFARSSHLSSQAFARAWAPTPGAASWGLGGYSEGVVLTQRTVPRRVGGWCSGSP